MNPYLEDLQLWPGVHHTFVSLLRAELNLILPEQYVADIDERVYVEKGDTARIISPDVTISRPLQPSISTQTAGGVALAMLPEGGVSSLSCA